MRIVRFVLLIALLWIAALLVVRQFVCIGWMVPIRVASHSMAPNLLGPHGKSICPGCGHVLLTQPRHTSADAEQSAIECLNCGQQSSTTASTLQRGSRVLIDRWRMRHGVQRFDVVALAAGGEERPQLVTKRVLGIPGELIGLLGGDVYANETIVRKTAKQFAEMAVLVHTDRHRRDDVPPRWRGADPTRWTTETNGYRWSQTPPIVTDRMDWLNYHHRHSANVLAPHDSNAVIYDDYQFNRDVSRALHRASDLAVTAELQWSGAGTLHVRCPTPLGVGEARLVAAGMDQLKSIELLLDDALLVKTPPDFSFTGDRERLPILVGYWDRQLICRWGNSETLGHRFERSASPEPNRTDTHFALAATGVDELRVTNLRIWRDLFYFLPEVAAASPPPSGAVVRQIAPRLSSESYLLLGDNVPQSKDARHGSQHGIVSESEILGIVVPVN